MTNIRAITRTAWVDADPRTARHAGRDVTEAARKVAGVAPDKPLGDAFKITLSTASRENDSIAPEVTLSTVAASIGLVGYKCGFFKRGK